MADHRCGDGRLQVWGWQIIGVGMADHKCEDGCRGRGWGLLEHCRSSLLWSCF